AAMLQLPATLTGPAITPTPCNAPEPVTETFVEARLPLTISMPALTVAAPLQVSVPARTSRCPPVNLLRPSPGAPPMGTDRMDAPVLAQLNLALLPERMSGPDSSRSLAPRKAIVPELVLT